MIWFKPKQFDTRIIKRFAWFPIRIGREKRWLERVYIKQRYEYCISFSEHYWVNVKFVDLYDYLNWKKANKR